MPCCHVLFVGIRVKSQFTVTHYCVAGSRRVNTFDCFPFTSNDSICRLLPIHMNVLDKVITPPVTTLLTLPFRSGMLAWLPRSLQSSPPSRAPWTSFDRGGARSLPPFKCTRRDYTPLHYTMVHSIDWLLN